MSNHGRIWWNELNTRDPNKAKAYYAALLGWTFDDMPAPADGMSAPYCIAKNVDGQPVAGIFTMSGPMFDGVPDHWFTYIAVDDVTKAVAESNARGGKVLRDAFDIPRFGRLAVVQDCNGAALAFVQPA